MDISWQFFFLLHNLTLSRSFESEFVIACHPKDERLSAVYDTQPLARTLTENFRTTFGWPRRPTPVLVKIDTPETAKTWGALVSWRNCYAIPCLLEAWQFQICNAGADMPLYSDFFEIYPTFIHNKGEGLVTQSLALLGINQSAGFQGQTAPTLPSTELTLIPRSEFVGTPLIDFWRRKYVSGKDDLRIEALLRSLDVAFQACRMPGDDGGSIFEFGSHVALWVSAFEIISHPMKGVSNLGTVLELLSSTNWIDESIGEEQYSTGPKGRRLDLVQEIYRQLYAARNAFLHGNTVSDDSLYIFKNKANLLLTQVAPLLYWFALVSFLTQHDSMHTNELDDAFAKAFAQRGYEDALRIATGRTGGASR